MPMRVPEMTWRKCGAAAAVLIMGVAGVWWGLHTPSYENKDWTPAHERAPRAETVGTYSFLVHNVRAFRHNESSSQPQWEDRTLDLQKLERLDYIVVPFAGFGAAHTMLSFGFSDGQQIGVSIEARREQGEEFSVSSGLLKRFELLYVIADERDLLTLRALRRGNENIYLYPVNANRGQIQDLFIDILARANQLRKSPEFYNTASNTCTTNLMLHINNVTPGSVPWWDVRLYLPRYSDTLAQELGFITSETPIEELRDAHDITNAIRKHADAPDFSRSIRRELIR